MVVQTVCHPHDIRINKKERNRFQCLSQVSTSSTPSLNIERLDVGVRERGVTTERESKGTYNLDPREEFPERVDSTN